MKFFYTLLVLSTSSLILSVNGVIPSYIHVCKRNDPYLTNCIKNSILDLRQHLVDGIPELQVPPVDPLNLAKLPLDLGRGFKAEGQNVVITGAKNFKIDDFVADINSNSYTFQVSIPAITAVGTYDIDAQIAGIPLRGRGPMTMTATSVSGRGTLYGRKTIRGGRTYNWFPSMNLKFTIADYKLNLQNLFDGDPTIGSVTNKLLNEEKEEVLRSMLPGFEKALIEQILTAANNICKHFTWEELFPDS